MNKNNLIYTIYKDGKIFHSSYDNAKFVLKSGNCYYIVNTGSIAFPFYIARDMNNKKEKMIGDNSNLVDFILKYEKSKSFVICGIPRSTSYIIFASVEQKRQELVKNENKVNLDKDDKVYVRKNNIMCLSYDVDNLLIGKFARNKEITEQKYIFEKVVIVGEVKYREIFTGEVFSLNEMDLEIPFVVDMRPITDYFPTMKGSKVDMMNLIFLLSKINHTKKNKLSFSRVRRKEKR